MFLGYQNLCLISMFVPDAKLKYDVKIKQIVHNYTYNYIIVHHNIYYVIMEKRGKRELFLVHLKLIGYCVGLHIYVEKQNLIK